MDFSLGETQGRRFRARFRFLRFSQSASLEARCSARRDLGAARNSPKSTICLYRSTRFPFCKKSLFRKRENVPISDTCPNGKQLNSERVVPSGSRGAPTLNSGHPGGGLPHTGAAAPAGRQPPHHVGAYPHVGAVALPQLFGRQKGGGGGFRSHLLPRPFLLLKPPPSPPLSTYYTEQHPKGTSSLGCLGSHPHLSGLRSTSPTPVT